MVPFTGFACTDAVTTLKRTEDHRLRAMNP